MPAEPDLAPANPPVAQPGASSGEPTDVLLSDAHALGADRLAGPAGPDTSLTEDGPPQSQAS
eukprot:3874365-Alexandrium_andersonii.AAC.1